MTITAYHDTRGLDPAPKTFTDVIVQGIAPGGGLYIPVELPTLTLNEVLTFSTMPYWRRAAAIFSRFGVDVSADRIDALARASLKFYAERSTA